ncbi:MAG: hypothetical protein AAGJ40_12020 [Planctomycetota bacterium]
MRSLMLLGLAVGAAFMAGWFTIERDGDQTRIGINKAEIRSDARQAIDRGRDILDKREQEMLAAQQGGNPWPPQNANPIQDAGFNSPVNYNTPNYNTPANYNPPPSYNPNANYNNGYPAGPSANYQGEASSNASPNPYGSPGYPPANGNYGGAVPNSNYANPGQTPPQRWSGAPQQPAPWTQPR